MLLSHHLIYRASAEQQAVVALAPGHIVGLRHQELLHCEGIHSRQRREMLSLARWIYDHHSGVVFCTWRSNLCRSSVERSVLNYCWFIYGACVSCSSILCSIYSQTHSIFSRMVISFSSRSHELCTKVMQRKSSRDCMNESNLSALALRPDCYALLACFCFRLRWTLQVIWIPTLDLWWTALQKMRLWLPETF